MLHLMQNPRSLITQVTQQIQIHLLYADYVIGTNGATISHIRRASGATVTIQETRGVPTEMTVEINCTYILTGPSSSYRISWRSRSGSRTGSNSGCNRTILQPTTLQGYGFYASPSSATQPGPYGSACGAGYGY